MAPPLLSSLFGRGVDILGTTVDPTTGTISAQLGSNIDGVPTSQDVEWWQQAGFASRPAKAVPGQSCAQAIVLTSGARDAVMCSRDLRGNAIYGLLKDGETCVYGLTGQARTLYKADGSITHYTTIDNTPTGAAIYWRIAPDVPADGDKPAVPGSFSWCAPWGTLVWNAADGFIAKDASGARLMFGPASAPGPLSTVKSTASLVADAVEVTGNAACKVGLTNGVFVPVATVPTGIANPISGCAPSTGLCVSL